MNLTEMIAEVRNVVQDSYWTDNMITAYLNQGLKIVATGVMINETSRLTPPLPDLYTTVTLAATAIGAGMVDMPTNFDRRLEMVVNADGDAISLDPSFKRFLIKNPKKATGAVSSCCQHGGNFLYRDIPSVSEELILHYYSVPPTLTTGTDEPTCLPEILHKPVIVGYACVQIFNQIEDGIEGKKVNAEFWLNEFRQGLFNNLSLISSDESLPDFYIDSVETRRGRKVDG